MLIRVVDFETTGLPEVGAEVSICEIGWCDVVVTDTGNVTVGEPKYLLCNSDVAIPPEVRAIHHITDDELALAPPPDQCLPKLLEGGPFAYAAHRADFEQTFFNPERPWVCTYKVALRLWPDAPGHSNQVLRYALGLEVDAGLAMPPHRAGPDAYVTAHLLARCLNERRATLEDMMRWSNGRALLPRITFGKHKGSKFEDIPGDYLDWILTSDLDDDVKANARFHLRKRALAAEEKRQNAEATA